MPYSKRNAPNCEWCPFKKNCFYDLIETKEGKKRWREMRLASPVKPGEVIFHEGTVPQGLFVVCKGRVKIYKSSRTGQQLITRVESAGDLVGHVSFLARDGAYTGTAESLEPSVISMVDAQTFKDFLTEFPDAALALMREMARDIRRGENKARDIAFKPARARLADVLVRMMKPGKPSPVVAGLKRRDLAEMAGLTIETSVRLLKDFESRGLIRRKDRDIAIIKEDDLRNLVGVSS